MAINAVFVRRQVREARDKYDTGTPNPGLILLNDNNNLFKGYVLKKGDEAGFGTLGIFNYTDKSCRVLTATDTKASGVFMYSSYASKLNTSDKEFVYSDEDNVDFMKTGTIHLACTENLTDGNLHVYVVDDDANDIQVGMLTSTAVTAKTKPIESGVVIQDMISGSFLAAARVLDEIKLGVIAP